MQLIKNTECIKITNFDLIGYAKYTIQENEMFSPIEERNIYLNIDLNVKKSQTYTILQNIEKIYYNALQEQVYSDYQLIEGKNWSFLDRPIRISIPLKKINSIYLPLFDKARQEGLEQYSQFTDTQSVVYLLELDPEDEAILRNDPDCQIENY